MSEESKKAQHREFTQSVITRMNTNSFQLKGMMITIVSAFLAVYAANPIITFIILPIPIVILFWFLDAYYLQLERKFRGIYKDICDLTVETDKKTTKVFEMNPKLYKGKEYSYFLIFAWSSLTPLYITIIACLSIFYYVIKYNCFG